MNSPTHHDPVEAAVDAMFDGNDDQAKSHLRAALADAQRVQADAAVVDELERRMEVKAALRSFAHDHPTVARDPTARNVADQLLYDDLHRRGYSSLDDVPIAEIGGLIEQAGTAAERYLDERAKPEADGGDASAVIARMRAARSGQPPTA